MQGILILWLQQRQAFWATLEQTQWGEALVRPESNQETERVCLILSVFLRCMFFVTSAFIIVLIEFYTFCF